MIHICIFFWKNINSILYIYIYTGKCVGRWNLPNRRSWGWCHCHGPGLVSALPAPERWTWLAETRMRPWVIVCLSNTSTWNGDVMWFFVGFNEVHHQHDQFDMSLSGLLGKYNGFRWGIDPANGHQTIGIMMIFNWNLGANCFQTNPHGTLKYIQTNGVPQKHDLR